MSDQPRRRAGQRLDSPDREIGLGAWVRARRRDERLTQRELADLAGVGRRAVWDLERGKSTMRMDVVDAVLAVFGKRLGIVDAPPPPLDEAPEDGAVGEDARQAGDDAEGSG